MDEEYLMETLGLTKSFIARHARAMGAFGRPRRFFLRHVLEHLEALAEKAMKKAGTAELRQKANKRIVNELFKEATISKSLGR